MANLPPGTSSLGPFYVLTDKKNKFVEACKEKGLTIGDGFNHCMDRMIDTHGRKKQKVESTDDQTCKGESDATVGHA
jgi:hypothetical protein